MSSGVPGGRHGMGTVRFSMTCSLDGYVTDPDGDFRWTAPSEEMHAFVNRRVRELSTFVLGRAMYETLKVWDDWEADSAVEQEFADLWAGRDKIVCSDSLDALAAPRTTLEPRLTTERLAEIAAGADGVVEVAGPTVAAEALRAGLVDEIEMFVAPHVLGGGTRAFPDGMRTALELVESRPFAAGAVFLRYRTRP
ncbi:dihydrofolate reductase family protein [Isoptericola sp. 178]|uniref:dihydrofolate reductase family protein n=2 Tax=unclassified Isoptericola TaxID=2623355 RepID=UPI003512F4F0